MDTIHWESITFQSFDSCTMSANNALNQEVVDAVVHSAEGTTSILN